MGACYHGAPVGGGQAAGPGVTPQGSPMFETLPHAAPSLPLSASCWQGLAVSPFEGGGRGTAALLLLQALCPEVCGEVAEDWRAEVPDLLQHLEGGTGGCQVDSACLPRTLGS